jgi:NADH-quinone oxidoreductase subunit N
MLFLFQTTGILNPRDLQLIAPELIITIAACAALVMEVILPYKLGKWTAYFALAGIALALTSVGAQFVTMGGTFHFESLRGLTPADGFYGMIHIDGFALIFRAIFLMAAALAIAISIRYLDIER